MANWKAENGQDKKTLEHKYSHPVTFETCIKISF